MIIFPIFIMKCIFVCRLNVMHGIRLLFYQNNFREINKKRRNFIRLVRTLVVHASGRASRCIVPNIKNKTTR